MTSTQRPVVTYYRVSTARQGASGLGLEAQKAAVLQSIGDAPVMAEFVEVESGTRSDRPKLAQAIKEAKDWGAVLVIAKLDRLARNVHFISGLMEAKVDFRACDFPDANRLTLHVMAAVAEHEAEMISARTRAALKAAKARGVKLGGGNPVKAREALSAQAEASKAKVRPILDKLRSAGVVTLQAQADALNARGIKTPRGGMWSPKQVSRLTAE
jgi:DNA invertase Pin-like site-specific DNA recombinase